MLISYIRLTTIYFIVHTVILYFLIWYNSIIVHSIYNTHLPFLYLKKKDYKNFFIFSWQEQMIHYDTKQYIIQEKIPLGIINYTIFFSPSIGFYSPYLSNTYKKKYHIPYIFSQLPLCHFSSYDIEYIFLHAAAEINNNRSSLKEIYIDADSPHTLNVYSDQKKIKSINYFHTIWKKGISK